MEHCICIWSTAFVYGALHIYGALHLYMEHSIYIWSTAFVNGALHLYFRGLFIYIFDTNGAPYNPLPKALGTAPNLTQTKSIYLRRQEPIADAITQTR